MFKILAAQRMKSVKLAAAPEPSTDTLKYADEMIPFIDKLLGSHQGTDHKLQWNKHMGDLTLVVKMEKSGGSASGLALSITIPELKYYKLHQVSKTPGRDAKWTVHAILNMMHLLNKLPKYKDLDDATKQKLVQFTKQVMGY